MLKTFSIFLISLLLMASLPLVAGEPALRYQSTGSSQLLYRAHFHWKEEMTLTTNTIRFDSDRLDEKSEKKTEWRKMAINKAVRRQEVPEKGGELASRIVSTVQREESSKNLPPLLSQKIVEFYESAAGVQNEPIALEAIPYFGIPLLIGEGQEWKQSWQLRIEDGSNLPMEGRYHIDRTGILAGRECIFVSYQIGSAATNTSKEIWSGGGNFAFDVRHGVLLSHQGKILRRQSTEEFLQTSRTTRQSEATYEVAEVLVP